MVSLGGEVKFLSDRHHMISSTVLEMTEFHYFGKNINTILVFVNEIIIFLQYTGKSLASWKVYNYKTGSSLWTEIFSFLRHGFIRNGCLTSMLMHIYNIGGMSKGLINFLVSIMSSFMIGLFSRLHEDNWIFTLYKRVRTRYNNKSVLYWVQVSARSIYHWF